MKMDQDEKCGLDKLYKEVYYKLRTYTSDPEELLDVVQEAWTRCYEHHQQSLPEEKLVAWIVTVGKNLLIDKQRARKRRNRIQQQMASILEKEISSIYENELDRIENIVCILQLAQSLSSEERQIILLVLSGNELQRVATLLNLPYATVSKRYQRACQHIRKHYQESCHNADETSPPQDGLVRPSSEDSENTILSNDNES